MPTVKAPYNFVPLPQHVFFPKWADRISQDIPFAEGISGTITLTVQAETPVFIRNGHAQGQITNSFSKTPDGTYFIPATSIKGCLRNVLEIMSFCKMMPITGKKGKFKTSPLDWETKRVAYSATKQNVPIDHLDLAECIFGTVKGDKALKGRVQFTNLLCTKPVRMPNEYKSLIYVLNGPNPDCLPMYVPGKEDYDHSKLKPHQFLNGWKRYVLKNAPNYSERKNTESRTTSTFCPLNTGSEFKGKVFFHNLLPQELGALLCAITWGNHRMNCYHQIGLAKPYGFGRISIAVDWKSDDVSTYVDAFIKTMNDWLKSPLINEEKWDETLTVSELFILASHVARFNDTQFKYMRSNEIRDCKNHGDSLEMLGYILENKEE